MSLVNRVQQGFLRLTIARKGLFLSSALLMLSPLLPWYDNRNSFGLGDSFIGLKGPLFLVGTLVMVAGAISFFNLFLPLTGKAFFKSRKKSGLVGLVAASVSLLLILVANSVFFHPDFGSTANQKATRFGMMLAFASSGVMLLTGYWAHRKEKTEEPEDIADLFEPMEAEPQVAASVPVQQPLQSTVRPLTTFSGDPLTLDARTRYKMMKRAESMSQDRNYWGMANQSQETSREVTENMKIRTDL